MVRMRDVLRSVQDLKRPGSESSTPGTFGTPPAGGFSFPNQTREPARPADAPKVAFPDLMTPAQPAVAADSQPAPAAVVEPVDRGDLYNDTIRTIDEFLRLVAENEPLDLGSVEQASSVFCEALSKSDMLFMQGLSARRSISSMAQHSANTAIIAIKIAMGLGYPREKIVEVGICAMVHEVGMTRVPQDIITKKGGLSPAEFELIKQHTIHGRNILEAIRTEYPFLPDTVSQEHERWNGNGYPFGLKEDQILEYAQVLGLADTFVALTHLRNYRDNFIAYKAIQSIIERRNIDFSAKMIKTLIDVISIFPVGSLVKLNDGCVARVIQTNKKYPVRPVIQVVQDSRGMPIVNVQEIDLSREPMIYIVSPILDESAYI